jgi:hypothetical protein
MHLYVRIHHWVFWWFYMGVLGGVVALVNILTRDLTRIQERVILVIGVLFWLLGGLVCHAYDGVQIEKPRRQSTRNETPEVEQQREWRPASDFVLPGRRKGLLRPKHLRG